jgi:hypothetical protein
MNNKMRIKDKKLSEIIKNKSLCDVYQYARKQISRRIIKYFVEKKIEKHFSDKPIIIGGCGRSGTTLLLSILGAHPHIHAIPRETSTFLSWHSSKSIENVKTPELSRLYRYMVGANISIRDTRWCEKTPRNVRHFAEILSYYKENVRIIHIIRDGRDVLLSRHPTKPNDYWVPPSRWVNDVRAGLEYVNHPQVLTIKYENLIFFYNSTVAEICKFLDEDFVVELKDWQKNTNIKNSKLQEKAWGVNRIDNQKIHSKNIGKWKKFENKDRLHEIINNKEVFDLLKELSYL